MSFPTTCTDYYNRGFTLLEIIVSLVIVGIMATMLGSGLVYSVQLYRTVKSTDETLLQANAAFNLIRTEIQKGRFGGRDSDSCTQDQLKFENSALYWNNNLILSNVSYCKITNNLQAFSTSHATVQRITISLLLDGNKKTYEFDVDGGYSDE